MSGAHETAAEDIFLHIECRGRLKSVLGVHHLDFGRLHSCGHEHVEHKVLRRRILGEYDLSCRADRRRCEYSRDHNAVAAVGPVHLLKNAGHDSRILWRPSFPTNPSMNSGTISNVAHPI